MSSGSEPALKADSVTVEQVVYVVVLVVLAVTAGLLR